MKTQGPYISSVPATVTSTAVPERRASLGLPQPKVSSSREPGEVAAAPPKRRAAFYVDGFNLYHALLELGDTSCNRYLRWLNLWDLAKALINNSEAEVVRVVWCTAEDETHSPDKRARHREYVKALRAKGVVAISGHFVDETRVCKAECRKSYRKRTEKAGDVNVAIYLIADGFRDVYDECYLVTADSDQVATVDMFQQVLKPQGKTLTMVAPPGQVHSRKILDRTGVPRKTILLDAIERNLLEKSVLSGGRVMAERPKHYDPPVGWVRPTLEGQRAEKAATKVEVVRRKRRQIVPRT